MEQPVAMADYKVFTRKLAFRSHGAAPPLRRL